MRRLSIANANGFILVYAATSASSFACIKQCFEEIREQRNDYQVSSALLLFTDTVEENRVIHDCYYIVVELERFQC